MQKQEERTIGDDDGDVRVITTQLPALRAFKLASRLGKLLGPAFGHLRGVKLKADISALAPVLMGLFESLDPEDIDSLTTQILEGTAVIDRGKSKALGSTNTINEVFSGRLILMFKVMAFAIEVNFRDFFRGLTSASAQPGAQGESPKDGESH